MHPADDHWFAANPERSYRLRQQTDEEAKGAPLLPGFSAWCAVRRSDGAQEPLALGDAADGHWPDDDAVLALLFDRERTAA